MVIVPKRFVYGIGEGEENRSGVVGYDWVYDGPCGRGKHFVVSQFVGIIRGYYPPEVVIPVHIVVWDAKYYWSEEFTNMEKFIVLGFFGDRDESRPGCSYSGRHIFVSHWP